MAKSRFCKLQEHRLLYRNIDIPASGVRRYSGVSPSAGPIVPQPWGDWQVWQ